MIASPTIAWVDPRAFAAQLRALGVEVLPEPFAVADLLAAAGAAVERGRGVRRRSDAVLARMHDGLNKLPPV